MPGSLHFSDATKMQNPNTGVLCETIGIWDYFYGDGGDLYRARAHQNVETRKVEFMAPQSKALFALRLAQSGRRPARRRKLTSRSPAVLIFFLPPRPPRRVLAAGGWRCNSSSSSSSVSSSLRPASLTPSRVAVFASCKTARVLRVSV